MYLLDNLFVSFVISIFYTFFSFLIMYALSKIKNNQDVLDKYGDIWNYLFIVNMIMIFIILIIFNTH